MKKKEIKKTKTKTELTSDDFLMILKGIDFKLGLAVRIMEVQFVELGIIKLRKRLNKKIDLDKLSQLEKRVFILEEKYRRQSVKFKIHKVVNLTL